MQQLSAERKGRITGSAVGAILGLSPFMTRYDVMRRMVRDWHGLPAEFTGNVATEYGHQHEPMAIMDYELKYSNIPVEEAGFFIHPEHDWLGATPDGLIGDNATLEIKCPFGKRNDETPAFKTLADQQHYYAQVQIELACTGRQFCEFFQWNKYGSSLEAVPYSPAWLADNLPKLREFYEAFLIEREFPECEKYFEQRHKEQDNRLIIDLMADYQAACEAVMVAEENKNHLKEQIILRCNGRESVISGHKVSKVVRKGNIQYNKIPELKDIDLEQYRGKDSEFWVIK